MLQQFPECVIFTRGGFAAAVLTLISNESRFTPGLMASSISQISLSKRNLLESAASIKIFCITYAPFILKSEAGDEIQALIERMIKVHYPYTIAQLTPPQHDSSSTHAKRKLHESVSSGRM
ncbi:MAG: hypothetical protein HWQ35_09290 [Nostoc sp. NMS1]|uniref:hypothetical protein n=1 Tax=Nostoc sp. NMS1 TaxID=2815388 RepID=UPI0025F00433|nr:hypothetical protein [Nostoc sp. NMS1]MBN3906734.1 hypothetical protein [Nostoc sp. NMS1]